MPSDYRFSNNAPQFPQILATRFYMPPLRSTHVLRERLTQHIQQGITGKLALISAPAGYGKTTLLSEWGHQERLPAAWLALGRNNNDPLDFIRHLIAALQSIHPDIGKTASNLLNSPQPLPARSILTDLIHDVTSHSRNFALIIDDYHLIDTPFVHDLLEFLIDHQPPHMYLLISTRSDPPLQFARLRSQQQLIEIRAADLCFTTKETILFFNEKLNLALPDPAIKRLRQRTEGWIAGLQLAAFFLKSQKRPANFIQSFNGGNRYIADYLMEEALNQQSTSTQNFLLQTSILKRLSGPLCNAVTQQDNSEKQLLELERNNLFIFPLDHERHWFRYHPLFMELLGQELKNRHCNQIKALHQRASEWCLQNGFEDDAIDHTLAAENFDLAIQLIENVSGTIWARGQTHKWLSWFKQLPENQIRQNPRLCILHALALGLTPQPSTAETYLQQAERLQSRPRLSSNGQQPDWHDTPLPPPGCISTVRALLAAYHRDIPKTLQYAREALAALPASEQNWQAISLTARGLAHCWSGTGNLEQAQHSFSKAQHLSRQSGNMPLYLLSSTGLAISKALQGHLKEARYHYQRLLRQVKKQAAAPAFLTAIIHAHLGSLFCEMNNLDSGFVHLQKGIEIAKANQDYLALAVCYPHLIKGLIYKGDLKTAREHLTVFEDDLTIDIEIPGQIRREMEAYKIQLWIADNHSEEALHWMTAEGIQHNDPLQHHPEPLFLALARILIANNKADKAAQLLTRLFRQAESAIRPLMQIETNKLKSLAFWTQNQAEAALKALQHSLSLAESGGFFRTFLAEGQLMGKLLEKILHKGEEHHFKADFSRKYARKLFLALRSSTTASSAVDLIEPLSKRELEVLHFIAAGLSNQEIAQELFISLNTVRTHTKNINSKLNVHSRTQAIARAKTLKIL